MFVVADSRFATAKPLNRECMQRLRRLPVRQHFVVIDGLPAPAVKADGGVDVLGDGVGRHPAHGKQCTATED